MNTSFIILTTYFFFILEILLIGQSFFYTRRERKTERPVYTPKVAIVAPHYGWDDDTAEHAKSLLDQDYEGDFQICFVTHQKDDSGYDVSYPHLQELVKDVPYADVLLAPNIIDNSLPRSQKVQNLMTVIESLPEDVEVIAFVDADVTIQKDWLKLLVTPLQDKKIGATVGGRFYFPQTWNFPSLVEATWVNFQMALQGDHWLTMVWGGSNAFRREFLEKGQILQRWEQATIEDLNTTRAVRDVKCKIHFVPDCVAVTRTSNRTWGQIFEFTNRQMIMTRHMGLWAQWFGSLILFLPKAVLIVGAIPFVGSRPALLPVVFIPFFEVISYRLCCRNLPQWLRDMPRVRDTLRISKYAAPFSIFLAGINALYAAFQRKIVWGGVRYEILSATTCKVLGRVKDQN
ncbi:glycosyltransferase family 2 protein [Candidatus Poribacteria bacterium]|nr:glycosyltransferase family 2 protein [Candidatus Poribacteria bacterium]